MLKLTPEQLAAVELLREARLDGDEGMPQELFLLISGLVPLANVDLLITDEEGRLLLARRHDPWYPDSWHIPGGCMHYGETFRHCIEETSQREIGTVVAWEEKPLAVKNVIRGVDEEKAFPRERGHNVAVLFRCRVPAGWQINNGGKRACDDGYLAWFDKLPPDFMKIQHVYDDELDSWR